MTLGQELISARFDSEEQVTLCSKDLVVTFGIPGLKGILSMQNEAIQFGTSYDECFFVVCDNSQYNAKQAVVYNSKTNELVKIFEAEDPILAICTTELNLIYSTANMLSFNLKEGFTEQKIIKRTNLTGVIAQCPQAIAWADDLYPGAVFIAKSPDFIIINTIQCHSNPIHKMAFSNDGSLLVTASTKGTIIRVFNVDEQIMTAEFRRGYHSSDILSLAVCSDYVGVCSKSTIHMFEQNGKHHSIPTNSVPLASKFIDDRLYIVYNDCIITSYDIDESKIYSQQPLAVETIDHPDSS